MPSHRSILAVLLLALLAGCANSSHPSTAEDIGHHGVGEQDRFRMMRYELLDPRDGVTSKDDVLRLLGQPDAVTTDGSATVHHWMAYETEWPPERWPDDSSIREKPQRHLRWYFFLAEFDAAGRLRRHAVQSRKEGNWSPERVLESWSQKPATRPSGS